MAMSFPQHRDVFHVWPCSPSNGTRLQLGCAKVGLSLVLSAGEELWLLEGTRGLTEVRGKKKK